jgi:NADPH:quinone reductase-like Zn-dependent oxidoreductase
VVAPSHVVAKLPDDVSFEAAAAIPTAGFTAYQVVEERFRLNADSVALIHAGAGALGGMAIQLAKRRGARVITTCSAQNEDWVRKIGADDVVDYSRGDLAETVRRLTHGRGADAILDAVGPAVGGAAVGMLAFQGHLACCVGLPDLAALQPLPRGIQLSDIALGWAYLSHDRRAQARLAHYGREMAELVATRVVDPMLVEILAFDQAIDALRHSRSGRQRGKRVIRMA